ncbi:hypothetical protein QYS60_13330 [Rhodococcus sp. GXMU-t2271]|nr:MULTISPECIES: hypothetical protein [Rhodococcus]MDM7487127.1 hypothetical protein [Rhodococcus indonesiensis]
MILVTPSSCTLRHGASFVSVPRGDEGSSHDTLEVGMVLGSLAATLFTLLAGLGILL